MSQEDVEIVLRAFEAFSGRDRDAWRSICDDALEAVPSGDWPETATIRGREAVWDFFLQAEEPWETGAYQLAEMIDAEDDRVVAHQVREMRGKESGVTVRYDYWAVFRVHAGKVIRVEYFGTRAEALKAVGLKD